MDITKDEKRIGNIGARLLPKDGEYSHDIVCYYQNPYYESEKDFIKIKGEPFYAYPDMMNCRVHEDCFKNPESCFTIACITNNEEPDVRSIGLRPWELNEHDTQDFIKLIKLIIEERNSEE